MIMVIYYLKIMLMMMMPLMMTKMMTTMLLLLMMMTMRIYNMFFEWCYIIPIFSVFNVGTITQSGAPIRMRYTTGASDLRTLTPYQPLMTQSLALLGVVRMI